MHAFPRWLDKTKTDLKPDHCNNSAPHNKPGSVGVGKRNSLGIDRKRDLNSEVERCTLGLQWVFNIARGEAVEQSSAFLYVCVYVHMNVC